MYAFIRGKLVEKNALFAIIDVNGVGYQIHIPSSLQVELPASGMEVMLHTSFVVRENEMRLFGFLTKEERDFFEELLNISGVGPKTALALLGHLSLSALSDAISRQNITSLTHVPGIGKKTAERLLMELKGKIPEIRHSKNPGSEKEELALSALLQLGYPLKVAQRALEQALKENPHQEELSSVIASALKCTVTCK